MSDNKLYNGIIYTIKCTINDNLIYVGSTTKSLNARWECHKNTLNSEKKKYKLHKKMEEIGINYFYIELYEELKNCTKQELLNREGEMITQIGTLNMCTPGLMNDEEFEKLKKKVEEEREQYKYKILTDVQQYERDNLKKEYAKRYYSKKRLAKKEQIV